jgi:hypothetical protein
MKLQLTLGSELDALRAERDAWRRRAESSLRWDGLIVPRRATSSKARFERLTATVLLGLVMVVGAALLLGRQEGARPDYPGCIGKARYEHPIEGNQYQELVNALYACEVYRTG